MLDFNEKKFILDCIEGIADEGFLKEDNIKVIKSISQKLELDSKKVDEIIRIIEE